MEKILHILMEIKPFFDADTFLNSKDLYGDGILNSLDILMVLEEIHAVYAVQIGAADFTKEDFYTVQSILGMVKRNGARE